MVLQTQKRLYTIEEFDEFVMLPENLDKSFEYIGGEIVEMVSNNYSSEIAARILTFIGVYLMKNNIGRITGADGGYMIGGERYIPDVAFISNVKQPAPSHEAYNSNPPDLAIEVLSPGNTSHEMRIKVTNYQNAGTVLWIVDPEQKHVEVYTPNQKPQIILFDSVVSGGDVLPDFELNVKDIFPDEKI